MSEKRFEQAIELAKVQAKITEAQTDYYSTSVAMLSLIFGCAITIFSLHLEGVALDIIFALMVAFYVVFYSTGRQYRKNRKLIRQDFERIYDSTRVEY